MPLRRFCPQPLSFAALIIGSMAPDFGYFVGRWDLATAAHSLTGAVTICVPVGMLVFSAFCLLRRPLCLLLPQPHRSALIAVAARAPAAITSANWLTVAASILIGASTHCVWDSFTHSSGWAVARWAWLGEPVIHIGATAIVAHYVLQHASTAAGTLALAWAYVRWLRRQAFDAAQPRGSDGWRYLLLATLLLLAGAVAVPLAIRAAAPFDGLLALRVLIFRMAVYGIAAFVPLFVVASIAFYAWGERSQR